MAACRSRLVEIAKDHPVALTTSHHLSGATTSVETSVVDIWTQTKVWERRKAKELNKSWQNRPGHSASAPEPTPNVRALIRYSSQLSIWWSSWFLDNQTEKADANYRESDKCSQCKIRTRLSGQFCYMLDSKIADMLLPPELLCSGINFVRLPEHSYLPTSSHVGNCYRT